MWHFMSNNKFTSTKNSLRRIPLDAVEAKSKSNQVIGIQASTSENAE